MILFSRLKIFCKTLRNLCNIFILQATTALSLHYNNVKLKSRAALMTNKFLQTRKKTNTEGRLLFEEAAQSLIQYKLVTDIGSAHKCNEVFGGCTQATCL